MFYDIMANSRTERMHLLLIVSDSRHCISHTYLACAAIVEVGRLSK